MEPEMEYSVLTSDTTTFSERASQNTVNSSTNDTNTDF